MNHWDKQPDSGWAKTNKKMHVDESWQEIQSSLGTAMTDVFARSSRKIAPQVCKKYEVRSKTNCKV
jgi:hypothetical protein